jgi:hypothetical protein
MIATPVDPPVTTGSGVWNYTDGQRGVSPMLCRVLMNAGELLRRRRSGPELMSVIPLF